MIKLDLSFKFPSSGLLTLLLLLLVTSFGFYRFVGPLFLHCSAPDIYYVRFTHACVRNSLAALMIFSLSPFFSPMYRPSTVGIPPSSCSSLLHHSSLPNTAIMDPISLTLPSSYLPHSTKKCPMVSLLLCSCYSPSLTHPCSSHSLPSLFRIVGIVFITAATFLFPLQGRSAETPKLTPSTHL